MRLGGKFGAMAFLLGGIFTDAFGQSVDSSNNTDTIGYTKHIWGNEYYYNGKEINKGITYQEFEINLRRDLSSDSSALGIFNEGHKYLVSSEILAGTGGAILGLGLVGSVILRKVQWEWIGTGFITGFVLPLPIANLCDDKTYSAILIFNRDKKNPNTSSSNPNLGAAISKSF